jgi:rhamnosyltransferase
LEPFALCIPIYNPGHSWGAWLDAFNAQTVRPAMTLVVDSSSTDGSAQIAKTHGLEVVTIPQREFNHGKTRQMAVELLSAYGVIVFLTQDAILAHPTALKRLVESFLDAGVGAACGRQLPRLGAGPIEAHARFFNYPDNNRIVSMQNVPKLGIKAAFLSNSFAAYRQKALHAVCGFPKDVIFGEDMVVAARLLLSGWKIAYRADACVYHSHNYSIMEEFRRYFDVAVLHQRERWLLEMLGRPESEGKRFVKSELRYLTEVSPRRVPEALLRTIAKYIAYRIGRFEKVLPLTIKKRLSMHKGYWQPRAQLVREVAALDNNIIT